MSTRIDPDIPLLSTDQMAEFVARGVLRLEAVVPPDINDQAVVELPHLFRSWVQEFSRTSAGVSSEPFSDPDEVNLPTSGTPLAESYSPESAFGRMVRVPVIAGAIQSLVGRDPVLDHHFIHLKKAGDLTAQELHCDAIIDSGPAFDVQLFWFPHDVAPKAGGTRFVPGSHLRRITTDDVARYEHLAGEEYYAGPAGTVMIFHQGLWHAGAPNHSDRLRVMGKLRLNPTTPQVRLWDTSDVPERNANNDHIFAHTEPRAIASRLRRMEPWFEQSAYRLELVQRALLWRYISDDASFDVDWYLTRTEQRKARATAKPSAGHTSADAERALR